MKKTSMYPCPICKKIMCIIGTTGKGEKIASCGHKFKFKKTKSKKLSERKYIKTAWGLELA